ncbi:MAG: YtxH domain-containing protein [Chloroflexi bacterium]|nr:MAG: YtxH domain-containing protein [Chloroflexota bacterium]
MGFIIGVLTGAVVALLYAPKTGDITREELKIRSEELKRRADELQKIAQKLADDASVKGRELIDEAKKQWDSSAAGRASTGSRSASGGSSKQD